MTHRCSSQQSQSLCVSGGRVCSFSPCIEQVMKTCEKLTEIGFVDIQTLECLVRSFDIRTINLPLPDLGYPEGHNLLKSGAECSYHQPVIGSIVQPGQTSKEKEDSGGSDEEEDNASRNRKKWKTAKEDKSGLERKRASFQVEPSYVFKSASPPYQMPGHTGYLTFATLFAQ